MIDYLNRNDYDKRVKKELDIFLSLFNNRNLKIESKSSKQYNKFINISFRVNREKRYSVSELSTEFKKHNVSEKNMVYLISRYVDGLYLLSDINNKSDFIP
jgi:hypothetical protein